MQKTGLVLSDRYYDSVSLMLLSRKARELEGVIEVSVVMGTPNNIEQLKDSGLLTEQAARAEPNDLIIALACEDGCDSRKIIAEIEALIKQESATDFDVEQAQCWSLRSAFKAMPDADMALVSVPGPYAANEAEKALNAGLNVMIFSDNVSIQDELRLKTMAEERNLLVMGPDCGTAIIDGVPLAFANLVPSGPVGIVGASGTGIQEITVQLARRGAGISHAIGTGGRDLSREIGGISARRGIKMLAEDPQTSVICLISKPPAEEVAQAMIDELKLANKPFVIHFPGSDSDFGLPRSSIGLNLAHTAELLTAQLAQQSTCSRKNTAQFLNKPGAQVAFHGQAAQVAQSAAQGRKYIRGIFCGGTLADEAQRIIVRSSEAMQGQVYSNIPIDQVQPLQDPLQSCKHTIVDMGEDFFTRGRAHPMIDPEQRTMRMEKEAADPETGVILFDIVLGRGSHPDPAQPVAELLNRLKASVEETGNQGCDDAGCINMPIFTGYVCGTDDDPQDLSAQEKKLEEAGAIIAASNAEAALIAARLVENRDAGSGYLSCRGIINIGLQSFARELDDSDVECVHVNWSPPAWGDLELAAIARRLLEE